MKLKPTVLLSFFMVLGISLTVYGRPGKNSKADALFRIPKKITCVDDLPLHLREEIQKDEVVIQLFPDEVPVALNQKKEEVQVAKEILPGKLMAEIAEAQIDQTFHVVTGSFRIKPNAEKLVKELRSKGYSGTHIDYFKEVGLYRVIIQEYNNEKEAENYLQAFLTKNPNMLETWILQKEKMEPVYYSENL